MTDTTSAFTTTPPSLASSSLPFALVHDVAVPSHPVSRNHPHGCASRSLISSLSSLLVILSSQPHHRNVSRSIAFTMSGFNSSDIELEHDDPIIAKIIEHASEDRLTSKKAVKTRQMSFRSESTEYQVYWWWHCFQACKRVTLQKQ